MSLQILDCFDITRQRSYLLARSLEEPSMEASLLNVLPLLCYFQPIGGIVALFLNGPAASCPQPFAIASTRL